MDASAFDPESTFMAVVQAADQQTGSGYGELSFEWFVQEDVSGSTTPVSATELAGILRDYLQQRGWTVGQFTGTPMPETLDWPEGT